MPTEMKPPFVLVHGAFHGGWCWRKVADRLRAAGHSVFTPTLTGLGERSHLRSVTLSMDVWTQDILGVLFHEELQDVVLVGHSLGGATITHVADREPQRLRHLVYLDAAVVESGQSVLETMSAADASMRRGLATGGEGSLMGIPPMAMLAPLWGMRNPDDIDWVARHLTEQPAAAFSQKWQLRNPLGNGVPATYVACKRSERPQDIKFREPALKLASRQPGWQLVEWDEGHNVLVENPDIVADLLLRLARQRRTDGEN